MNKMVLRGWTWQWLALLGLLGLIFYGVTLTKDLNKEDKHIEIYYEYKWSDVALANRGAILHPFNHLNHPLYQNN